VLAFTEACACSCGCGSSAAGFGSIGRGCGGGLRSEEAGFHGGGVKGAWIACARAQSRAMPRAPRCRSRVPRGGFR